ncbi:MAG: aldose 1-epimerase family protein [Saprospiraceae bacterium]
METYTISNDKLQLSVKEQGAEIHSFKSFKTNREYIWQADPEIWPSHAPNLFPIIGCLKDDAFIYKGKEYKCPKHGLFRNNKSVNLINQSNNSLTFGLQYNEETLAIYPFKFDFQLKYILENNKLTIQHDVNNLGLNTMFFSLGGHPGFSCPLNEDEVYSDYYLEFNSPETAERWHVLKDGLIAKKTSPVFDTPTTIKLHNQLFDKDALVFKDLNSTMISLKSNKSHQVLSVEFEGFPYLGIWAKPNAPYVCIEPWLGIADSYDTNRDLENKEGILRLEPQKSFTASYYITIEE